VNRPVVLIADSLSEAVVAELGDGFDVRWTDGPDRTALLRDIADADAVLVRSATQIDAEALAAAPKLKVIARAGVGLDNVDIPAATRAGVMVINAPTSNIISAAELAVGLILASLRNIAPADASMKRGEWARKHLTGTELHGKTVGVVGFGKIGVLVAERLRPFGVELLAYDPYVPAGRAAEFGARLVGLDELMRLSDVVTVHMPKTPETLGLIGAAELALAKPTLHIVNAARGGLIDEQALADALSEGRIAAAALDVFTTEPPADNPVLAQPNVTLTPHLGASTDEAQEKAGVAVAQSVRLALAGELVPDAVNVAGGALDELVRPGVALADRLGQVFSGLATAAPVRLEVVVRGEIAEKDVRALQLSALRGVFRSITDEPVSYVNAPVIAEERGIDIDVVKQVEQGVYRNEVAIRGVFDDGRSLTVTGTLSGTKQTHKLIGIDDYEFDLALADHLIVYGYADRPGMVGRVGTALGEAGINIAGMQVSRSDDGRALVVLTVDDHVEPSIIDAIGEDIGAGPRQSVDISY
jgi:D-3-phosphoglycerate dehydrogenase / 2-oxoglutarate reductase